MLKQPYGTQTHTANIIPDRPKALGIDKIQMHSYFVIIYMLQYAKKL